MVFNPRFTPPRLAKIFISFIFFSYFSGSGWVGGRERGEAGEWYRKNAGIRITPPPDERANRGVEKKNPDRVIGDKR
jgi:hypothetical protein